MYTTYTLATINTVNEHTGFLVLAIAIGFLVLIFWADTTDNYSGTGPICILAYLIIMTVSAYISWHSGEITTYVNKPVNCDMVEFWGEGHTEQVRSGKTTHTVEVHNQYVSYRTPDGIVSFPIVSGQAYPEHAILYKN